MEEPQLQGFVFEDIYATLLRLFKKSYLDSKGIPAEGSQEAPTLTPEQINFSKRQMKEFLKTFNQFMPLDSSLNQRLVNLQQELSKLKRDFLEPQMPESEESKADLVVVTDNLKV